jgi:hypothetical protein
VVEIPEPFIEPVHRGQELVAVTEMILAELSCEIALALEHLRQRRIFLLDSAGGAWDPDRRHAGANRQLSHDEGGATGRAARLTVVVREQDAVLGNAIDVRRPAHHPVRVDADIPHADVVTPDYDDVRFSFLSQRATPRHAKERQEQREARQTEFRFHDYSSRWQSAG